MKKVLSAILALVMMVSMIPSFSLTAEAAENGVYKIVLTWNSSPSDLDSHLIGKNSAGNDFHIYYRNMNAYDTDGSLLANLDTDDTSSYGPETTTIFKSVKNATNYFYVYNYSGSPQMAGCGAVVKIYKVLDSVTDKLMGSYTIPNSGSGRYWNVFKLRNNKLTVINKIGTDPLATAAVYGAFSTTSVMADSLKFTAFDTDAFASGNVANIQALTGEANGTLEGVTAHYNSTTEEFDKSIRLKTDDIKLGLKFTKDGYRDYIIPLIVASDNSFTNAYSKSVYMAKDRKDGKPYVSTVFCRMHSERKDGTNRFKEVQRESFNITDGNTYDVFITAGNISGETTYVLSQDDNHKITNTSGYFRNQDLYSTFAINRTVYAYVINNGVVSETMKLKLKKVNEDVLWLQNLGDNHTFSFLRDTKLTLSDDIPVIGGAEIGLDLLNIPLGVELENDTFKISLGVDLFERKADYYDKNEPDENGKTKSKKVEWKSFKDLIKKSKKDQTVKQLEKLRNQLIANKFGKTPTKGSTLSAEALGYIEGQFLGDKLVITEFGGSIAFEFIFEYTQHFSIGPVPCYMYIDAGAEASLAFTKARAMGDSAVPFDFGIKLGITPSVKVGGGAGVKDAVSVGLWGRGSLPFENDFSKKYRKLSIKGEFGAEAQLFCFSGSVTLLEGEWNIIDGYYGKSSKSAYYSKPLTAINKKQPEIKYCVMPRTYSANTSEWLGANSKKRMFGGALSSDVSVSELKTSVFANSKTQLVKFGNKLMMAWIDDDTNRDEFNRMKLVYSVYDNGAWSEPKAVYDDGCNDNAPALVSDGNDVYVAWQKTAKTLTEEDSVSFDSILACTEIYFAKYDSENDEFINAYRVTNDEVYDYSPALAFENGDVKLYFATNNENDLTAAAANTIKYCGFNGDVNQYETSLNELKNLTLANVNDELQVAYIMDGDGDGSTLKDVRVYANTTRISENDEERVNAISMLEYGSIDGSNTLFWSDGTNIYYYENGKTKSVFKSSTAVNGNINIVEADGKTQLFWTQSTEAGSDVFTCSYSDGEWSESVQLTDTECLLSDVCISNIGSRIIGVFDRTQRIQYQDSETEEYYYESGLTDLCQFSTAGTVDAAVSIPYIEEGLMTPGEDTIVQACLENTGSKDIENMSIIIRDDKDYVKAYSLDSTLKSGEIRNFDVTYTVPENFSKTTLSVEVICGGDTNTENNVATYSLGNVNLQVSDLVVESFDDCYQITGSITNCGAVDAEEVYLDVGLRERDYIVMNSQPFSLAKGETHCATVILTTDDIDFEEDETSASVWFTAYEATEDENDPEEFYSGITIEAPHQHTYSEEWTVAQEATCTEKGVEENVCDVCGETVQRDIEIKPHAYDDGVITQEPTCTATGVKTFTCADCGATRTESVDKIPHSYSVIVTAPTCLNRGYTNYICSVCGYTYTTDYLAALGHDFVDDVCTRCGREIHEIHLGEYEELNIQNSGEILYSKFIPEESGTYYFYSDSDNYVYGYVYDSNFNELSYASYSSGENGNFKLAYDFTGGETYYLGARYYYSNSSGRFYIAVSDSFTSNHTYELQEAVQPTCMVSGYKNYKCKYCSRTYYETLEAPGHNFVDDVCTNCGQKLYHIGLNEHLELTLDNNEEIALIEFTPEESGTYYYYSDTTKYTYGYVYNSNFSQLAYSSYYGGENGNFALSYNFTGGETYYLGAKYYNSGYSGSFYVAISDSYTSNHTYELQEVVQPTCMNIGYSKYVCKYCAREYQTDYSEKTEHIIVDNVCTICGNEFYDASLEEYVTVKDVQGTNQKYVIFVPEEDGLYYFYSHQKNEYINGVLYDENMNSLYHGYYYNSSDYGNFQIIYNLEAGKVYYIGVCYNSSSKEGDIRVCVSKSAFKHNYSCTHYDATEFSMGYDSFTCDICGDSYDDNYVYPTLTVGETKSFTVDNEYSSLEYSLSVEEDGVYKFTYTAEHSFDILYNNSYVYNPSNDYHSNYYNRTLEADKEYRVRFFDFYTVGEEVEISITKLDDSEIIERTYVSSKSGKESFELFENTDGYETSYNGQKVFVYRVDPFGRIKNDIVFTVEYKDGHTDTYTYNGSGFCCEETEAKLFDGGYSYSTSEQSSNPWTLGNTYSFKIGGGSGRDNLNFYIPVTIVDNPVERVEFVSGDSTGIYEGSHSYWYNNDGEFTLVKYGSLYSLFENSSNTITLFFTDGTSEVYEYNGRYSRYESENGNFIRIRNYSAKDKENWTVGSDNYITIELETPYGIKTVDYSVLICENPIKDMRLVQEEPIKLIENEKGYYTTDSKGNRYFHYDYSTYDVGTNIEVTYQDGSTKTYYGNEDGFVDEDGNYIYDDVCGYSWSDFTYQGNTNGHFTVGNTYKYVLNFDKYGYYLIGEVEVIENPISSISYTPANQFSFIENTHGYFSGYLDSENEEREYYRYDVPYFRENDVLTVNYKDERGTVNYTLTYEYDEYGSLIGDNGEVMNAYDLKRIDTQSSTNQWTLGENYFTVSFKGITCSVPITITENPVASISFTPVKPVSIIENFDGWWHSYMSDEGEEQHWFEYNVPRFNTGDILTVEYTDGRIIDYYYPYYESDELYSQNGDVLDISENYSRYSNQYAAHWTVGGENHFTINYLGRECSVPVSVIENPVDHIEFIPVQPYKFMENSDGYYRTHRVNGVKETYFHYDFSFADGDIIRVHNKDGSFSDITRFDNEDDCGWYDENNNYVSNYVDNYCWDEQNRSPWKYGNENNGFRIAYCGKEVFVPVEIIGITDVSFSQEDSISLLENYYGEEVEGEDGESYFRYNLDLDCFGGGETITVSYSDGSQRVYELIKGDSTSYFEYRDDDGRYTLGDISLSDNQASEHWQPGNTYTAQLSYSGYTFDVQVYIVEDDVESIEYIPKNSKTFYAFEHYDIAYDDDGGEHYIYRTPHEEAGDKVILHLKDGTQVVYTCDRYSDDVFLDENGNALERPWYFTSYQYDGDYWNAEGDNYYYFYYKNHSCQLSVNIIDAELTGFTYTPSEPIVLKYGYDSFLEYNEYQDEVFDCYRYFPSENDKISLTYSNGDETEYVYDGESWVSESGLTLTGVETSQYSNQCMNPWTIGGENYAVFRYKDFECFVPVTVEDTDVAQISFTPVQTITLLECVGGYYEGDIYIYEPHDYVYKAGNTIEVTYKDGSQETLTCKEVDGEPDFYDSSNNYVHVRTDLYDAQKENPWVVGSNNEFTLTCRGVSTKVKVTVQKSSYTSMSYTPASPITLTIGTDYRYDTGLSVSAIRKLNEGDRLFLKKNGALKRYTLNIETQSDGYDTYYNYKFVSSDGEEIDGHDLDYTLDVSNISEGECTLKMRYSTVSCEVPVTVVNPCEEGHTFDSFQCSVCGLVDFSNNEADPIEVNTLTQAVVPKKGYQFFSFTPEYSGTYTFESYSEDDTYAYLYSSSGSLIIKNDDGGDDNNFLISKFLDAGETYYFACRYWDTSDYGRYNVILTAPDTSALDSLKSILDYYDESDFTADSYQNLLSAISIAYGDIEEYGLTQEVIDNGVAGILSAIYDLVPYLSLNISASDGGSIEATCSSETLGSASSLVSGSEIELAASCDEGYSFEGWYETVSKRFVSKDSEYNFKLTSNTNLIAVFKKDDENALIFTNTSNQIVETIYKTAAGWSEIENISAIAPKVPFSYGNTNGRWLIPVDALETLKRGETVVVTPVYDKIEDAYIPEIPEAEDVPEAVMYYTYSEEKVGSFVMALAVPENCEVVEIGTVFYYGEADSFNPGEFTVTVSNKMLVSKFTEKEGGIFVSNINRMTDKYNWAARGYVTYEDGEGNLTTVYSNQINVAKTEWVD